MSLNANLSRARRAKNDEFYTRYEDIEAEVMHYADWFWGCTVLLPCDGPQSNFVRFFTEHYDELGLTGLLTSSGDFRSAPIDKADIIVTNPPFSLFREFFAWLVEADKDFLILGTLNAITHKDVFQLIKANKVRLGVTTKGQDMVFGVPPGAEVRESDRAKAARLGFVGDYTRLGNIRWFTNMHHGQEPITRFARYDNYDAIDVPRVADIPPDYLGVMGVPITFLDTYNPERFEIVGVLTEPVINGQGIYKRLLVKRRVA